MSAYDDLYSDLAEEPASDLLSEAEYKTLKEELEKKNIALKNCEEEIERLMRLIEVLQKNISSLFKTARSEIKRKEKMIEELRTQYEDLAFRRKGNQHSHGQNLSCPDRSQPLKSEHIPSPQDRSNVVESHDINRYHTEPHSHRPKQSSPNKLHHRNIKHESRNRADIPSPQDRSNSIESRDINKHIIDPHSDGQKKLSPDRSQLRRDIASPHNRSNNAEWNKYHIEPHFPGQKQSSPHRSHHRKMKHESRNRGDISSPQDRNNGTESRDIKKYRSESHSQGIKPLSPNRSHHRSVKHEPRNREGIRSPRDRSNSGESRSINRYRTEPHSRGQKQLSPNRSHHRSVKHEPRNREDIRSPQNRSNSAESRDINRYHTESMKSARENPKTLKNSSKNLSPSRNIRFESNRGIEMEIRRKKEIYSRYCKNLSPPKNKPFDDRNIGMEFRRKENRHVSNSSVKSEHHVEPKKPSAEDLKYLGISAISCPTVKNRIPENIKSENATDLSKNGKTQLPNENSNRQMNHHFAQPIENKIEIRQNVIAAEDNKPAPETTVDTSTEEKHSVNLQLPIQLSAIKQLPYDTPRKFINGEIEFPFKLSFNLLTPLRDTPDYLKEKLKAAENKPHPIVPMFNEFRAMDNQENSIPNSNVPKVKIDDSDSPKLDIGDKEKIKNRPVNQFNAVNNEENSVSNTAVVRVENNDHSPLKLDNTKKSLKNCGVVRIISDSSESTNDATSVVIELDASGDIEHGSFKRKRKRPNILKFAMNGKRPCTSM